MRTDCLFAHKVRSQQGVVKPLSSNFSSSSKESIHTVQCGFADDMDYQNYSDLASKCVEYGQI